MPGIDAFFTVCLAPGKCGRCEGTDADRFEDKTQPENPVPLCLFLRGAADVHVHIMLDERWPRPSDISADSLSALGTYLINIGELLNKYLYTRDARNKVL